MKYIFIAGLEHSGSTLLTHLINQHPDVISLGEVAPFFSSDHMKNYMNKWGTYPDAKLCSCGESWEKCPFWKPILYLNGLESNLPLLDKYKKLFQYIHSMSVAGMNKVIIDSSKSFSYLQTLLDNSDEIGLHRDDIHIILIVKDVRNFTTSIAKKNLRANSLFSHLRTFNWWLGANKRFINFLQAKAIPFDVILYEKLCFNAAHYMKEILNKCSLDFDGNITINHNRSHIAMGNKNFIMRNRDKIKYDFSWFLADGINLAYMLHKKARTFNKWLYLSR